MAPQAIDRAPQELLDFLAERGVDPADLSYFRLLLHLVRLLLQQQAEIAAIKRFVKMP